MAPSDTCSTRQLGRPPPRIDSVCLRHHRKMFKTFLLSFSFSFSSLSFSIRTLSSYHHQSARLNKSVCTAQLMKNRVLERSIDEDQHQAQQAEFIKQPDCCEACSLSPSNSPSSSHHDLLAVVCPCSHSLVYRLQCITTERACL